MSVHSNATLYLAVIGDIKGSKQLEDRDNTQIRLNDTLRLANKRFANSIASKFTITLGDEFQGLLHNSDHLFPILQEIEREMYPIHIRFGIGVGAITTKINPNLAIGADGPAYYNARKAIEYLKQSEKKKQTEAADIRIEASGYNQLPTELLNTILLLLTAIKQDWSTQQRQIIGNMLAHRDTQSNVAERMNIRQPTVQKSLSGGNYYAYQEALSTLEKTLREVRWQHV